MRKDLRNRWLMVAAIVPMMMVPALTRAGDFVFTGSGSWNTPTNWTPTGPPGALDRADIAGGLTATVSSSPASPVDTLYVGGNNDGPSTTDSGGYANSNTTGDGTLNQTAGDLVVNTWGVLGLNSPTGGNGANSGTGTYNLSGGSFTLMGTDAFTVGQGGTGIFNISGNSSVTINSIMHVGRQSGVAGDPGAAQGRGNGTVVQGGTSTVTLVGNPQQGNTVSLNIGLAGDGSYTLKDNATLISDRDVNVGTANHSVGILNQTGGTLNNTGGWFFVGNLAGSTGTYNLSGGTTTIAGRFLVGAAGTGTVNQTGGNLTVGHPGPFADDDINLGDFTGTGTYNISGGTLTGNGGITVGEWNAGTGHLNISGSAVVNTTDLSLGRNQGQFDPTLPATTGTITQTGGTVTVSGHTILGMDPKSNSNGNTSGTYTLSGGTLKLGTGGLQLGGTGNSYDGSGNVTTNNPGATGVFNLQGTGVLDANRSNLFIGAGAGSQTAFTMTGGTLQNAAQIQFPLNQQGGRFQPGAPGAPATTMITGDGTTAYTLASAGTFHIEIAGGTADELMTTSGATSLAGALDVLVSGTKPRHGATFTILSGAGISGHFANAPSRYISSQGLFHVNYSASAVTLTGFSLPGDANEDGSVNFTDLLILAQHYGQSGQNWNTGDFTNDGSVNFTDLLLLAQNYGQSNLTAADLAALPSAVRPDVQAAFAQVPEPPSLAVIGLVAAGVIARRRRS